ncbi:MAG: type II toxin-antitoxin system ParD family antitoxin [Candidatus Omnitrophica bacterium]|nr:type II toxin-antitoxin system ParD family antitoxin [Candidatus Omnitrophota bacterium]
MTTITINLPDSMQEFLDSELKERGIEDPSEYFQGLVIEDRKKRERERLGKMLQEGLDSEMSEMTQEDWLEIREEVNRRHAERINNL